MNTSGVDVGDLFAVRGYTALVYVAKGFHLSHGHVWVEVADRDYSFRCDQVVIIAKGVDGSSACGGAS